MTTPDKVATFVSRFDTNLKAYRPRAVIEGEQSKAAERPHAVSHRKKIYFLLENPRTETFTI